MSMSGFDFNKAMKGGALGGGLSGLFGGLFGGGDPYKDAMKQYENYANKAANYQNTFYQAGKGAIGDYQNYLQGMSDPSEFLNNLMSNYQESPYNQYLQQQSNRAGTNAASASGLIGSTPFQLQQQQNAANIAQGGMNDWLQNALGINNSYGSGLQNLLGMGQGAGNQLSNIFSNLGNQMGEGAYGSREAKNQQLSD